MHTLLIVENEGPLLQRLARAMEMRGFRVTTAASVADGLAQIRLDAPAYAVVDLRLDDGCGLEVISALRQQRPDARAIVQTGYGNIATAVGAVKLGVVEYLTKPADADVVFSALLAPDGHKAEPPEHPMSAARVRWEHIQSVYEHGAPAQHAPAYVTAGSCQTRAAMRRLQVGHDDLKRGLFNQACMVCSRSCPPNPESQLRGSGDHGRTRRVEPRGSPRRSALSLQGALDNCGQVRS